MSNFKYFQISNNYLNETMPSDLHELQELEVFDFFFMILMELHLLNMTFDS